MDTPETIDRAPLAGRTILQVIPALEAGGAERTCVEMAAAIVEVGGRALVASRGGRMADAVKSAGGVHVSLPLDSKNPVQILLNVQKISKLIKSQSIDLVHARSRAPAWSALLAARKHNLPFVTTYHGAYGQTHGLKRWYNSSMTRGDIVVANSAFTADAIAHEMKHRKGRVEIIHRGVDLAAFSPDKVRPERRRAMRAGWGLKPDDIALVLPARLTPWKGQQVAIDALTHMTETPHSERLTLVLVGDPAGKPDYAVHLRDMVRQAELGERVVFAGHCGDMPAVYAAADVVIVPSTRPEAFGRTIAEAGAMARVVIATDHGGARETVIHGETGFLVEPGDTEALAKSIERVLALPDTTADAMATAAQQRITENFSLQKMTSATIAAYCEALAAPLG
ncbi:MAG: glycosyltransferase family 4 protein [Pseudomonadota bacterium]